MPRPSIKTPDLIDEILDLVMAGYNLEGICSRKGMPNRVTVYRWLMNDRKFLNAYNKAVAIRASESFLDVFEIADRPKETMQDIAADALRINARLRTAHMANPALKRKCRKKFTQDKPGISPGEPGFTAVSPENDTENQ